MIDNRTAPYAALVLRDVSGGRDDHHVVLHGVEEGVIMKIMGWAPKTVFDRHYRSIAPERLQQAILKLYADDPL